jgi:signal peptidase I
MFALFFIIFSVEGHSMEPQFYDEERISVVYAPCPVGSVIAVQYKDDMLIKNLTKVKKDGSIYIEGRNDHWYELEDGVQVEKASLDSDVFGYIPLGEYHIDGCVYKLNL